MLRLFCNVQGREFSRRGRFVVVMLASCCVLFVGWEGGKMRRGREMVMIMRGDG